MELRFVGVKEEQRRILKACHADPMSGHMRVKRTLNRIRASGSFGLEWSKM